MRFHECMFVVIMTLGSGAVGYSLGGPAELLYSWENVTYIGAKVGLVSGLVVGALYSLAMLRSCQRRPIGLVRRGMLYGIAAGVVCSTIVHLSIMATRGDDSLISMMVGNAIAVVAGLVLGALGGVYLRYRHRPGLSQEADSDASS